MCDEISVCLFLSQVNADIPPRLKKSAHEVILEFIRSRPPLNPVSAVYSLHTHLRGSSLRLNCMHWFACAVCSALVHNSCDKIDEIGSCNDMFVWFQVAARKLKPLAQHPPCLHERILEEIKSERKLRPVSPDMIRRSRFGETLTHTHAYSTIQGSYVVWKSMEFYLSNFQVWKSMWEKSRVWKNKL